MSKYDDFLTEVAYEIDDLVYEYYRKTNEIIARKRNQEKLIDYRDKTISTVSDMNVKSMEIIASFKKEEIVRNRAAILVERNRGILESSMDVILNAPNKNEFLKDVSEVASSVYEEAKKVVGKVEESGAFNKIKEGASEGYVRLRDAVENFSKDPRVQEGVKVAKDKTKEIVDVGSKAVKEGASRVKEWMNEIQKKDETQQHFTQEDKKESSVTDFADASSVLEEKDEIQHVKVDINKSRSSIVEEAEKQISAMKDAVKNMDEGELE